MNTKKDKDYAKEQAKAQLESIKEMVAEFNKPVESEEDERRKEDAEQTIQEDALSVEVRSGWYTLSQDSDRKPAEYNILLCTGGPACRIIGSLSEYGEPETARIEYQDWGTPWTEYRLTSDEEEILLTYAGCFYFGE